MRTIVPGQFVRWSVVFHRAGIDEGWTVCGRQIPARAVYPIQAERTLLCQVCIRPLAGVRRS